MMDTGDISPTSQVRRRWWWWANPLRNATVTVLHDPDPFPPGTPLALQLEFTSRCQLRCRMCPLTTGESSTSASPGPMHDVVFDEVLRIARRCRRVILAGYGEPLTNPECIPMLRALDAEGIDISMSTNGIALTPEVARELVSLEHLTLINVSIDSPDPTVYNEVRVGNLERAMNGLRNLMAVIDDRDRVTVSSVAMQTNLASLAHFPATLAELGVQRYELQAVMDYTDYAQTHSLLEHPELETCLHAIEVACDTHGIQLQLSVPERTHADFSDPIHARELFYGRTPDTWDETTTRLCHVPWEIPFIDKDGGVFACCFAASANERKLGTIGPQTFDEIWTGSSFRQFRQDIVDGRTAPDICRRCTVAPLGRHLFKSWAADIESADITFTDRRTASVALTVRNTSEHTWTTTHHLRIGTSAPRDTTSAPLFHPRWHSPNRPTSMQEEVVPPGDIASFVFPVAAPAGRSTAQFEIVAEGTCWLPGTRFVVTIHPGMVRRFARAVIPHRAVERYRRAARKMTRPPPRAAV